jgi:heat shock protein HtpX
MDRVKVFVLMAGLTALLVVIGGYLGGQNGAILAFAFAALMNFAAYWWSDKMVLKMYRARIVGPEDAPELYQMVDRLRRRAGLPMPTVAIAPSDQPNAFATGRNYERAVVCCTAGLLRLVDRSDLPGLLGGTLVRILRDAGLWFRRDVLARRHLPRRLLHDARLHPEHLRRGGLGFERF